MNKDFKKIRSLVDRRKIWSQASQQEHLIVIKVGDFSFPARIKSLTENGIWIQVTELPPGVSELKLEARYNEYELLGYLTSAEDRYYFLGILNLSQDYVQVAHTGELFIAFEFEVYELDRRGHFRVRLPDGERLPVHITHWCEQELSYQAQVVDLSGAGLRLQMEEGSKLKDWEVGQRIKGVIYSGPEKTIQFHGEIRHLTLTSGGAQFGLQIVEERMKSSYRLMALTLAWQRKLVQ